MLLSTSWPSPPEQQAATSKDCTSGRMDLDSFPIDLTYYLWKYTSEGDRISSLQIVLLIYNHTYQWAPTKHLPNQSKITPSATQNHSTCIIAPIQVRTHLCFPKGTPRLPTRLTISHRHSPSNGAVDPRLPLKWHHPNVDHEDGLYCRSSRDIHQPGDGYLRVQSHQRSIKLQERPTSRHQTKEAVIRTYWYCVCIYLY